MPPPKPYREWNDLAAYQFDNAILFGGLVIENASQEREEYGPMNNRQSRLRYSLAQLLDPDFRLPVGGASSTSHGGIREMAMAYPSAVGRWKQVA
jgi:hypothetical protein